MFRPWLLLVALALFPVFLSAAVATAQEPEEPSPASPANVLQDNAAAAVPHEAARRLLERLLPERADEFVLETISAEEGKDVFEIESAGDKIVIRGNNGLAIATGLNWYLKHHCHCHVSWGGTRLELPKVLPKVEGKVRRAAWAKHRYFMNYCCFGFTLPFWDWQQWEGLIDWMALNGVNTPLSVTGQEGVWRAVCRRLGLTEKQIDEFLAGPPYLPFSWMGCIDGFGGPLPQGWIDSHIELQQKILERQRELGMTPVLQGFTGHVPPGVRQNFPDAKLDKISWQDGWSTNLLDPQDPLFAKIAKMYMQEQIKLFGTDHLYAADTFIEHTPPRGDTKYLADLSRAICRGMTKSDPEAVWVLQTWPFEHVRNFWREEDRIQTFLDAVPDERMLCLDLFCEMRPLWSTTEAFHGKPWLFCNVQSWGWRVNLGGNMQKLITDLPAARKDPSAAKLAGLGMVNEGLGYNPVVYDLMFEMAWRDEPVDLKQWLRGYAHHRYGRANADAEEAWMLLNETAHSVVRHQEWPNHYIIGRYPSLRPARDKLYDNARLAEAWRLLLEAADELKDGDPYRFDLVNVARQVLSNHAAVLHREIGAAYGAKDAKALKEASDNFLQLIRDLDELLATRQEFLLGPYLEDAKRWGGTDAEREKMEWNARRMITVWGPAHKYLRDYDSKKWSGMLTGYCLKRWQWFLDKLAASLNQNKPFDAAYMDMFNTPTGFSRELLRWDMDWAARKETYPTEPSGDSVEVARRLWQKYGPAVGLGEDNQGSGTWRPE